MTIRWARTDNRAVIAVIDHGVGIPRSEQRTIFRRFVRGRSAIDANVKGTGVGLSMVEQIVVAHRGEIRLESAPGQGSTFTLLLPLEVASRKRRSRQSPSRVTGRNSSLIDTLPTMSRILIVEDEPGIALALEDDLTIEGYRVDVVRDGVKR